MDRLQVYSAHLAPPGGVLCGVRGVADPLLVGDALQHGVLLRSHHLLHLYTSDADM